MLVLRYILVYLLKVLLVYGTIDFYVNNKYKNIGRKQIFDIYFVQLGLNVINQIGTN